jgi:phospholipid transport system transporter-binding protein
LTRSESPSAAFEVQEGERSRVTGALHFTTVSALLERGQAAITDGRAAVIDLSTVTESDSSGLALLIEWLSIAKKAQRSLRYENIPEQIQELARLSDVEPLLTGVPATA